MIRRRRKDVFIYNHAGSVSNLWHGEGLHKNSLRARAAFCWQNTTAAAAARAFGVWRVAFAAGDRARGVKARCGRVAAA